MLYTPVSVIPSHRHPGWLCDTRGDAASAQRTLLGKHSEAISLSDSSAAAADCAAGPG